MQGNDTEHRSQQTSIQALEMDLAEVVEGRLQERWQVSKLAHFNYGEGCGKLLAWKVKMTRQNVL